MVAGDDRAAALANAEHFDDARATHSWDGQRIVGRTWTATFFARHAGDLAHVAEHVPALAERFAEVSSDVERAPPAWDVALFFASDDAWGTDVPEPRAWSKQFDYRVDPATGAVSGMFWTEAEPGALVASSWLREFARGAALVTSR